MEYIKAGPADLEEIAALVRETILTVYPRYYPQEVVDFFRDLHRKENIAKDIADGAVWILREDGAVVGTGSCQGGHITRVYVRPSCQGRGYGTFIMRCLEDEIGRTQDHVWLDASLPACQMYEKRGYQTMSHQQWKVENGVILVYEVMKKDLRGNK